MTYPILLLAVALAGKPVAIPSDAEPSTKFAASELTNYLFRITGKASEVEVKGGGGQWSSPSVVIGTLKSLGDVAPAAARKALAKTEDIEAAWKDAFEVPDDLLRRMRDKLPFLASQKTTIRVMRDDENLYFHFPPSIENQYYQLGMTPKGGLCAEMTGRKAPGEFGGEFAHREEHYSIGGIGFLSTAQYHPLVIGEPKC